VNIESSSSQPPLSAPAEELLTALEESAKSASPEPFDPLHWLSALLGGHPEAIGDIATPDQLGALQAAMAREEVGYGRAQPLERSDIAALAQDRAREEGRPNVSSQDIASAVLTLVTERLGEPGRAGTKTDESPSVPEPAAPSSIGQSPPEAESFPTSLATKEMLDGLCANLGLEVGESTGVFRWLQLLRAHHDVRVDDEGGEGKLEGLTEWGIAREKSGDSVLSVTRQQVLAEAVRIAQEGGQPLVTPQSVAIAIVKLAMEAFTSARDRAPTSQSPPEPREGGPETTPAEPLLEPGNRTVAAPEANPEGSPLDLERQNQEEVSGTIPGIGSADPGRTRTFRLFVSSTFQDLQAERNVLQQKVFPRLRLLCARHGARFQAIDLRWGVSEEAGIDQQTMNICLGEIRRCHQVTPKPNFLVLLGDRYGWLPPPPQIPAQEFEEILKRVQNPEECDRLERWYQKDLNADPPEYRLRPRSGEREEYRDWTVWTPEEEGLRQTLDRVTGKEGLDLPAGRRKIYQASATEQEVLAGALDVSQPEDKVFCFFRRIQGYPIDSEGNPRNGSDAFISADPEDRDKLQRLKLRLVDRLPESCILTRSVDWGDEGPNLTDGYLGDLADWAAESLEGAILRELSQPAGITHPQIRPPMGLESDPTLSSEVQEHLAFAVERRRNFVGREDVLTRVSDHLRSDSTGLLAIVGGGGTGKSALMSEVTRRIEEAGANQTSVVRFVGATPGSSEGRFLLEGLCREIALRYGVHLGDMPTEYHDLATKLADQLNLASQEQPLVLLVDSLDQLSDPASGLSWIPTQLPPHVHMVVSTRPDGMRDRLAHRGADFVELGPLSRDDGRVLLETWLSSGTPPRRLQAGQSEAVLDAFAESDGNPLYLKLAAEEARRWPAWAGMGENTPGEAPATPLTRGVQGMIRDNLLGRLAHPDNHGSILVSRAAGYLAASRYGLAEDELIQLLSRDPDVYTWFLQETVHFPQDLVDRAAAHGSNSDPEGDGGSLGNRKREDAAANRLRELREEPERLRTFLTDELGLGGLQLPVVLWSRLSFDLEPYLTERRAEGGNLLSFYHRELGDVAAEEFLTEGAKEELHGRLADYFRSLADPGGDGSWEGDGVRGLSELPYHLTHAGRWEEVYQTLTDFSFLEQKASRVGIVERAGSGAEAKTLHTGVFQLQDDFDRALQAMPGSNEGRKEAHPLIVTAVDFGEGLIVRCPWCNSVHPLMRDWLGEDIRCPNHECGGPLKVNPFTAGGAGPA